MWSHIVEIRRSSGAKRTGNPAVLGTTARSSLCLSATGELERSPTPALRLDSVHQPSGSHG